MSLGEQRIREIYGWLPNQALNVYVDAYLDSEDPKAAWASVRDDRRYNTWFPGNRTDDGRVRMTEAAYAGQIAAYDEVFLNVGLDPKLFQGRYGDLISGDVTPQELETNRVNPMYDEVMSRGFEVKKAYSDFFGVDFTDKALLAAALDPDLGEKILSKQISMASVGGAASQREFDISKSFAAMLVEQGMDADKAKTFFGSAESMLPVLGALAKRYGDPEDDFTLDEYADAAFLNRDEEARKAQRLISQEGASFSAGAGSTYSRDRATGGVSGLQQQ